MWCSISSQITLKLWASVVVNVKSVLPSIRCGVSCNIHASPSAALFSTLLHYVMFCGLSAVFTRAGLTGSGRLLFSQRTEIYQAAVNHLLFLAEVGGVALSLKHWLEKSCCSRRDRGASVIPTSWLEHKHKHAHTHVHTWMRQHDKPSSAENTRK